MSGISEETKKNIENEKNKNIIEKIEKETKKNNFLNMLKGIFKPLYKEQVIVSIGLEKKTVEIILTEDEASDNQKKVAAYKKVGIDIEKGIKPVLLSESFHRNIFDLLTKKISLDTVILLLESLGNKYKYEISYIDDVIISLEIPNSLKQDLLKQKNIFALEKYEFPKKKDLMAKIRILSDKRTLKEKGIGFLELAQELKKEQEMKKKIKQGLIMPIIVLLLGIGSITYVNESLFPIFIKSFGANNPGVVKKITENIVYVMYHFVKNNLFIILGGLISLIILINILKNISTVKYYGTQILLKIPIIRNVIKYKELLKLVDILIGQYKYNLGFDQLYQNLTNVTNYYYLTKYYKYENIFNIPGIIQEMIKDKVIPIQTSQTLSTLLAGSGGYNNINEIILLKEDIMKGFKESIDTLNSLIQRGFLGIIGIVTYLVLNAVYASMYDVFGQVS